MVLVLAGRCVPMASGDPDAVFNGRVYISDSGKIEKVSAGNGGAPAGFAAAPVIDLGDALILPGFIDMHNHIAYNTLPLWAEETRELPYLHRDQWPSAPSYQKKVSWPASTWAACEPEAQLAHVQLRALAGGTTAIQGWPGANKKLVSVLRNVDDGPEEGGTGGLIQTSVMNLKGGKLVTKAQALNQGKGFIYHLCEGAENSAVRKEFDDAFNAGCLKQNLIAIHCNAVADADWAKWGGNNAGTVVWSPFSNLWLYGDTTDIDKARAKGINICIGSDWGPSGTKNVQGEIKVAKLASVADGLGLSDRDIVQMITCNPGDALSRLWPAPVGRLIPGAFADITILRGTGAGTVWKQIIESTEADVRLVVVNGQPVYGQSAAMQTVNQQSATVTVAGQQRRFFIPDPFKPQPAAWTFADITSRLNAVRANPQAALQQANARRLAYAGPLDSDDAPLIMRLDMPSGKKQTALTSLKSLKANVDKIELPPLPTLVHDKAFFDDIAGRGFHNGVLDGLRGFYA
jgi:5-methylthioadenosine/S-adenosylhomocysteine deaminase